MRSMLAKSAACGRAATLSVWYHGAVLQKPSGGTGSYLFGSISAEHEYGMSHGGLGHSNLAAFGAPTLQVLFVCL